MSRTERITGKTTAVSRRGMAVSHNIQAAEVGAHVLGDGGSAVDAAVAISFAPPGTGLNLYDVMMWMNPEPGTPNSVAP